MINSKEFCYTPTNLKSLITLTELSELDFALFFKINPNSLESYLRTYISFSNISLPPNICDLRTPKAIDMPTEDWEKLIVDFKSSIYYKKLEQTIEFLEENLPELQRYYDICNYNGKLFCASLIDETKYLLKTPYSETIDAYSRNIYQLKNSICGFFNNIEDFITITVNNK